MIIAASDEALRDSQISVKTSKLLALDQYPGSKRDGRRRKDQWVKMSFLMHPHSRSVLDVVFWQILLQNSQNVMGSIPEIDQTSLNRRTM
jgi:hypothetical protein